MCYLISESLRVRQQLGENQHKISSDADARTEDQIKTRMAERVAKSKKEEQDMLEKKKKNHEDLRNFFKNHVSKKEILPRFSLFLTKYCKPQLEQVEARKIQQKEEGKLILEGYMRIRDEANAQKEAQRLAKLQSGKQLQSVHLHQIVK